MPVQTMLLDFSVEPARLGDEGGQKTVFEQMETILKDFLPNLSLAADIKISGGSLKLLTTAKGVSVSVRLSDRGFVTVNIEYYKEENEEPIISFKSGHDLRNQLKKSITSFKSQVYAPIKRCLFSRYYPTSDNRLMEYDIDNVLFDGTSPFQRVQIVHSKTLGNMLVLDDLQNISEADLIYTETLMQRGKESYANKEIVILGGGDGALLYELMKEKPKFVWMLEIDEMVITACNKHMRSICGEVLDSRKEPNYEIIVEDCMVTVNRFIRDGRKVDYVFGDLTDIPISESTCSELWEFMVNILHAVFKILKPTGKFMTHGNGATCSDALVEYEMELAKMKPPVTFSKSKAYVPSFLEEWTFYQVALKNADNGDA